MIVVAGCSWSDPYFTCRYDTSIDVSYPKWFDMLDTDKPVKSLGMGGLGQDTIILELIRYLRSNNDVTHVVVALTDWLRFSLWNSRQWRQNPQISLLNQMKPQGLPDHVQKSVQSQDRFVNYEKIAISTRPFIKACIEMNMFFIQTLIDFCTLNNIRLSIFQMLLPFRVEKYMDLEFMKCMIEHPHVDNILDYEGTVGSPFFKIMGGVNMNDHLNDLAIPICGTKDNRISKTDAHPNGLGHVQIADWVNNNINF